jgi:hypothetical protein
MWPFDDDDDELEEELRAALRDALAAAADEDEDDELGDEEGGDDDDPDAAEDDDQDQDHDGVEDIEGVEATFRAERARIRQSMDAFALAELLATFRSELSAGAFTGHARVRAADLVEELEERISVLHAAERAALAREEARAARGALAQVPSAGPGPARFGVGHRFGGARPGQPPADGAVARAAVLPARVPAAGDGLGAPRLGLVRRGEQLVQVHGARRAERAASTEPLRAERVSEPRAASAGGSGDRGALRGRETGSWLSARSGQAASAQIGVEVGARRGQADGRGWERARAALGASGLRPATTAGARPAVGSAQAMAGGAPRSPTTVLPPQPGQAAARAEHDPDAADAADRPLTGRDLLRFRAARSLSQRGAAELLGVAHGTVAKAELLPDKALAEQLERALQAVLPR